MRNRLLLFAGIAGLLSGCGGRSMPPGAVESDNVLVFSDSLLSAAVADTVDMGVLRQGEEVTWRLSLRNDCSEALVITAVRNSCGCTVVDFPKGVIRPGETAPFTFTLKTAGLRGPQWKTIAIETSRNRGIRCLVVQADIRPAIR